MHAQRHIHACYAVHSTRPPLGKPSVPEEAEAFGMNDYIAQVIKYGGEML